MNAYIADKPNQHRDADGVFFVYAASACWRCTGTGTVARFSHVRGGVCFACGGARRKLTPVVVPCGDPRENLDRAALRAMGYVITRPA